MVLSEIEMQIIEDALNHYWHYVVDMLEKTDLGDIERRNLELTKKRLDSTVYRFR